MGTLVVADGLCTKLEFFIKVNNKIYRRRGGVRGYLDT